MPPPSDLPDAQDPPGWSRVVVESAVDAVVGVDEANRVVDWNRQAERLFGWSKAEALGRDFAELVLSAAERARTPGPLREGRLELEAVHRDGRPLRIEHTAVVLESAGRRRFYGLVREPGEPGGHDAALAEAERAARASAQQLRLVTDALPAFVAYIDRDGRYRFVNAAYTRAFGRPRDAIVGQHFTDVLGASAAEVAAPAMQRALAGEHTKYDNHVVLADGSRRAIEAEYVPDVDAHGVVQGFVVLGHDVTDQRRARATLTASEARFRTLFEQAPFSTQLLDASGRTLGVNRAWQELWGMDDATVREQIVNKYNIREDPQLEARGMREYVERGFRGEVVQIPAIRYDPAEIGLTGRPRWVEGFMYPVKSAAGAVEEVVLIHEDVTEALDARKAVAESEERFRLFVEAVQDYAIVMLDPAGNVRSWNAGAERISGHAADEIVGRPISLFYPPVAVERGDPARHLEIATNTGRYEEEGFRARRDGSLFWATAILTALREDGELRGFSLVTRDISARRRADEEKQTLASAVDSSSDFIGIADLDQNVVYVNTAGREMVGLEGGLEAVEGTKVSDYFAPDEFDRISRVVIPPTFAEGRWQGEVEFYNRRTGVSTPALMNSFVIRSQAGEIIAFANVSRDITELKRTQQRLEDAVRARDEFISICSHELKTPVTSLKLQFQAAQRQLQKGDPGVLARERVEKRIDLVNRQMDRMGKLIDDMLDVSRIATGRLQMKRERLDLVALAREVVERFDDRPDDDAPLTLEPSPTPTIVLGDRYRLEQVLTNLVTNGLKYGEGKPLTVRVRANGPTARLEVRDEGLGIAPESLERIFQRYERAIPATSISGLGLGLYISRQIVEAHRGRIWVESVLGEGSTFVVELPRDPAG